MKLTVDLEADNIYNQMKSGVPESGEFLRRKVVKKVLTHHPVDKKTVAKRRFKEKPLKTSLQDEFYLNEPSSALNRTDTDPRCK